MYWYWIIMVLAIYILLVVAWGIGGKTIYSIRKEKKD